MDDFNGILRQKLGNKFTEEQFAQINLAITETESEFEQKDEQLKKQEAQETQQMVLGLINLISTNGKELGKLFKPSWIKYLYDFLVAFMIIGSVVLLALNHILGACETSTILGGIVGYLLGKGAK